MTVATTITIAFLAAETMRHSSRNARCLKVGLFSSPNFTKSSNFNPIKIQKSARNVNVNKLIRVK